jgi:hypothetical protein
VERLSAQALTHATRAKPAADPPMVIAGRHRSAPARDDGRGHRGRLAAAVLLTVCALVSAAVVGFRWGGRALPEPASTVTPVALSWPQVWAGLDDRRARAFATGDATLLAGVYQPDCPALPPDLRAVRALANRQVHAVGVRHQATTVRAVSAGADTATLLVTDRMNSYQVRDSADQLVSEAPPRAARTLRAELVRTQRGWRIASLTRA